MLCAPLWSPALARLSLDSTGANPVDTNRGNGCPSDLLVTWLSGLHGSGGMAASDFYLLSIGVPTDSSFACGWTYCTVVHYFIPCCMLFAMASDRFVTRREMAGTRRAKCEGRA
jgi:hypothetical protein